VLGELLGIVAPVYVVIGLGYGWARLGQKWDTELLTALIMAIGAPCLVFSSVVGIDVERSALAEMGLATLLALAALAAVAAGILRIAGLSLRTFLSPMVFPNAGNMGLPVCLFAFGAEGLALGVCFYAVTAFVQYSAGLWIWSGRVSGGALLRTPLTWAMALAVAALAFEVRIPDWILRTTELLGGFTIPLMQLSLGVSLYRLELARIPRSLALALLRLALGLAVGFAVAELLGMTGAARGVLILDCAMPVAVLNYLLAERYGRSPSEVASLVVLSTLLSLVALPVVLAWVL
jgi:hypothetical protein